MFVKNKIKRLEEQLNFFLPLYNEARIEYRWAELTRIYIQERELPLYIYSLMYDLGDHIEARISMVEEYFNIIPHHIDLDVDFFYGYFKLMRQKITVLQSEIEKEIKENNKIVVLLSQTLFFYSEVLLRIVETKRIAEEKLKDLTK